MVDGALEVAAKELGDLARRNEPLGPRTTYRVGGAAALFVELDSEGDLARVSQAVRTSGVPTLAVGKGSNLLVAEAGFAGLAVTLGPSFAGITCPEEMAGDDRIVRVGAAASLPVVARRTVAAGLAGFEWAVGVPGSIGGAVAMNAGGHGSEMADVLSNARILDLDSGDIRTRPRDDLDLAYRHSAVTGRHLVVEADLRLRPGDVAAGEALLTDVVTWRRAHQPGGQNAGSVFTNPAGDSAGRLIDEAGCKGLRIGTAEVSVKHANFIQADREGSADDVRAVMDEVRRRVGEASGVWLRPETRMVGFSDDRIG